MKFSEFVNEQVARLEAIPGFQMGDAGRKELALWLMDTAEHTAEHVDMSQRPAARWIAQCPAAQRIKAVIDECVEFTTPPGLADIKAVWYRLYPPVSTHEKCGECGGTGWKIVKRGDAEGAVRCSA
jgi:hypothetical protein